MVKMMSTMWLFTLAADAEVTAPNPPESLNHLVNLQLLILAAGLVKVSDAFAWIIGRRKNLRYTLRVYRELILSLLLIGAAQLQYAWTSYYEYPMARWPFWAFSIVYLAPLCYLFAADLLYPDEESPSTVERVYSQTYQRHYRVIFALVICVQVINIAVDLMFHPHEQHLRAQNVTRVLACIVSSLVFWFPFPKHRRLHLGVLSTLLLALIVYCVFFTPAIQVK